MIYDRKWVNGDGDGDGERFAQVRDQGLLSCQGNRRRKTHCKRDFHRRRVPVGDLLLSRHSHSLRTHLTRPERQWQAQGAQPLRSLTRELG
ncbi:hypothetical protein DEO72_LG5g1541 [Vigna unguiculata]|uniref:Uncharacterized protein n=1 Tax=Vigna unguiculata TaxID=3917 RepID=A0A4D6LZQ3_VIGUN|nr:hypothetical protein DEO72_LG5g1541 [Vigna unguiculata]